MDFGNSSATQTTERIMATIRQHLKQEPPPHESHHYNRVYEAVHRELEATLVRLTEELKESRERFDTYVKSASETILELRAAKDAAEAALRDLLARNEKLEHLRNTSGEHLDMLMVDRLRAWAQNIADYGSNITTWGSPAFVETETRRIACDIEAVILATPNLKGERDANAD